MYLNFMVSIPEGTGISRKTIKGTTYVYYEYGRKYVPERKYTIPQCTSIGKVCDEEEGMMIPNGNYVKYFPDADMPEYLPESTRSGCLKIGSYLVIRKIIRHYYIVAELNYIMLLFFRIYASDCY